MDHHDHAEDSCCAPARMAVADLGLPLARPIERDDSAAASEQPTGRHRIEQASIPAQTFVMGDSFGDGNPGDGEWPTHPVQLDAFEIDATSVTNDDFARFVDATGYRTEAETFGYSAVFHLARKSDDADIVGQPPGTPWWFGVRGADWRHPGGALSDLDGLADHPVVHVSWNDAVAYCEWAGRRLPTEAEWDCASRGGLIGKRYPWGDQLGDQLGDELGELGGDQTDGWPCNIWQGTFPSVNTQDDGWLTTAPVRTYRPNAYGLWQTVGNVWEWCNDWWNPDYYAASPNANPAGPASGEARMLRGGSYLCHDSYCNRYRNSARSSNTPDSSMGNAGFRTVALS